MLRDIDEQNAVLANDTRNNSLSALINDVTNEDFACHMWYPKERKLIRVEQL